jgi:hypothetical protein
MTKRLSVKVILGLFLLLLGVAGLAALGEIGLRVYFPLRDRSNPYILRDLRRNAKVSEAYDLSLWEEPGVRYRKNASLELDLPDGERLEVRINSRGFRTREFATQKPPGLFRIICLGGSTTVIGRTNEETYPALLEENLRRRYPERDLEVLNFGVSKYGTSAVVDLALRSLEYRPDLVIKYNGANDLWWDYFLMLKDELPAWKRYALRSYLFQTLFPTFLLPPEAEIRAQLRAGLFPSLDYLKSILEGAGGRLVILTFFRPDLSELTSAQKYYLDFNVRHFWGRQIGTLEFIRVAPYLKALKVYNDVLREFCREWNVPCIDLERNFPRDFDLYIDICHFSQEGIEEAATLIVEELAERGLIPANW